MWAQGEMHTITRDGSCVFTVPAGGILLFGCVDAPGDDGGRAGNQTLLCIQGHGQQYDRGKCGKLPGKSYDGQRAAPTRRERYMEQYGLYEAIPGMDQIEVFTGQPSKIIVAFGDSITAMNRWVKPLKRRLFDAYGGDYALMTPESAGIVCFMISRV